MTSYNGQVPKDASGAYLLSGSGGCPPEDCGGLQAYTRVVSQLCGKVKYKGEIDDSAPREGRQLTPSHQDFWDLLNDEIRAKPNMKNLKSPLDFDLGSRRSDLHCSLRRKRERTSAAYSNWAYRDFKTGIRAEPKAEAPKKPTDPRKYCAICEVTVALRLCSACQSIAFCSSEHQLQNWPTHKAECKRIQKLKKKGKK